MKPRLLAKTLECDDGIFNVRWEEVGKKPIPCEWTVLGGRGEPCGKTSRPDPLAGDATNYWCVECGLVVCRNHRKGHATSPQHEQRLAKWREDGTDIPVV